MKKTEQEIIQQLQEEKQFKETLLGISEAISSIRDLKELFQVVLERIKPLFNFYDIGLFLVDEPTNSVLDLTAINPEIDHAAINKLNF